jgi:Ca2+-binding RTX toxin-like protein
MAADRLDASGRVRVLGMLMLAGLLVVLAAGAAAFVGFEAEPVEEEDLPADAGGMDRPNDGEAAVPDLLQEAAEAVGGPTHDPSEGKIISGEDLPEAIDGTPGQDQVNGYDGADTVRGGEGDDLIHGSGGQDDLAGDAGDDTLHGGDGQDSLRGGDGADRLFGHDGQDTLHGGAGHDSLVGSAGNDLLFGDDGNDALHGDIGNDTLQGGQGQDTLFGGWGDDVITGIVDDPDTPGPDDIDGRDYLNGGGGNDLLIAGRGDVVTTGSGNDTIVFGDWLTAEDQAVVLDFSDAEDRLAVLYDDTDGQSPVVTFESDEDRDDYRHLVVNGVRIAVLVNAGDLTPADVMLVPLSQAGPLSGQ